MDQSLPLAEKLRPQTLNDYFGQEHLVGPNGLIKKLIQSDNLPSMIFWGPPGSGKTTLARIIAGQTKAHFLHYSAVTTKLEDVRKAVKEARERKQAYGQKTILFLDEIHRFNKAQQDAFLPHIENGTIILIGATTENPSFEIIGPLLSRCRVFVLNKLTIDSLDTIITRVIKLTKTKINKRAIKILINLADGDARVALNALEIAQDITKGKKISVEIISDIFQHRSQIYDKNGEEHYNTISAFIKSMRASDPNASLYYLARMVEAGEDPLFIARRMIIFASEDIGLAQPTALAVANAVFQACEKIGYPECQINLAHGVSYLAQAKKNRSSYDGYFNALADVKNLGNLPIPFNLRNAPTKLMKELGYSKGYEMYPIKTSLLPDKIKGKEYLKND